MPVALPAAGVVELGRNYRRYVGYSAETIMAIGSGLALCLVYIQQLEYPSIGICSRDYMQRAVLVKNSGGYGNGTV